MEYFTSVTIGLEELKLAGLAVVSYLSHHRGTIGYNQRLHRQVGQVTSFQLIDTTST